jgi:extracellular elastinolytic metalloproteinase
MRLNMDALDSNSATLQVTDTYSSEHNGITHVYLIQSINSLEVVNAVANVNIATKSGNILSYSASFYQGSTQATPPSSYLRVQNDAKEEQNLISYRRTKGKSKFHSSKTTRHTPVSVYKTPIQALESLLSHIGLSLSSSTSSSATNPPLSLIPYTTLVQKTRQDPDFVIQTPLKTSPTVPAKLKYIQTSQGASLVPVWDLVLDLGDHWFHAHVSAETGEIMGLVDWVSDAAAPSSSYRVLPLGVNDPLDGDRVLVLDPSNDIASPLGWHSQAVANYTVTIGNNVYAQENLDGKYEWLVNISIFPCIPILLVIVIFYRTKFVLKEPKP